MEFCPRLAGPGTVRAWEKSGIAGSISRQLSSFPGLLDLCTEPLLKCVHGVFGEGSPSSPVMSTEFKLLEGNFWMAYAGLYAVFESLEKPSLLLLPRSQFPKHQLLRSVVFHADDMSNPAKSTFQDHGFNAGCVSHVKNL